MGWTKERGPRGPIGPLGPIGPEGPQGIQGIQGVQGEKGDKGDAGSVISVNDIMPDSNGNVSLGPTEVGADPLGAAQAVETLVDQLGDKLGDLNHLDTTTKDTFVNAINEIAKNLIGHMNNKGNPHKVTSSQVNWLEPYTISQNASASAYPFGITALFVGPSEERGSWLNYGTVLIVKTHTGGATFQLYIPYSDELGGKDLLYRTWQYQATDWSEWKKLGSGGGDSGLELVRKDVFSPSNPFTEILVPFRGMVKRLKFVVRGLGVHHTLTGTMPSTTIDLRFVGNYPDDKYATYGYKNVISSTTPFTSMYSATLRDNIPLFSVGSSTTYPYLEWYGEFDFRLGDYMTEDGIGVLPYRFTMDGWARVRNPQGTSTNAVNILNENYHIEFPLIQNGKGPDMIGIKCNRTQGFTRGEIEVWGEPL